MLGKINKLKDANDNKYVYPLTVSKAVMVNESENLMKKLNSIDNKFSNFRFEDIKDINFSTVQERSTVSYENGGWKVVPDPSNSYKIELDKWNIKNDGTNPINTSINLNLAITWASENGYDEVVLPKGTYLIDENNPIIIPSRMTFNLGGSTLCINPNGLEKYTILLIQNNSQYIRITNGTLKGDKDSHDYNTISGTHEWGMGITVYRHTNFIQLDFLEIYNFTGDGIYTEAIPNFVDMDVLKSWEQGSISTTNGTPVNDINKIRTPTLIPIPKSQYDFFNINGNSWGDFGSEITTVTFNIMFYNDNGGFIDYRGAKVFDDIEIPKGATHFKLVLNQSTVPTIDGVALSVCISLCPRYIYIEKCDIHHCRRCGIAATGKHLYIRDNTIHHIWGGSPASVIDVEDGYGLNQNIRIYNNFLYDCRIGVAFVDTQHVNFTGNYLYNLGQSTVWDNCRQVIISNNILNGSHLDLLGEANITGNTFYHSQLHSRRSGRHLISGNYFYNSKFSIDKTVSYTTSVNSNYFYRDSNNIDSDLNDFQIDKNPQIIKDCLLENCRFISYSDQEGWIFDGITLNGASKPTIGNKTLPSGTYKNCLFQNLDDMSFQLKTGISFEYNFTDCIFNEVNFVTNYNHELKRISFMNSRIFSTKDLFISIRNLSGEAFIEFVGNSFDITPSSGISGSIIRMANPTNGNFSGIILDRNQFKSDNSSMSAINFSNIGNAIQHFTNNTLINMAHPNTNLNIIQSNNLINGILDPHLHVELEPSIGMWETGQIAFCKTPINTGYVGWVCVSSGIANNNNWRPSTMYSTGTYINSGEKVYLCVSGGQSSTTAPSHTSGTNNDNNITWEYVGAKAVFKPFGQISH